MGINRHRKRQFSNAVEDRAQDLYLAGLSAPRIAGTLEAEFPGERTPLERTIRKRIPEWEADQSGRWTVTSAAAEDAVCVVGLLPSLYAALGRAALRLTVAEADVLTRLARGLPDMPPIAMYRWTRRFVRATSDSDRETLLAYLALTPWRDRGVAYASALRNGIISEVLTLTDAPDLPAASTRVSRAVTADAIIVAKAEPR